MSTAPQEACFTGLSLLYRLPQQKRTSPQQQILQLPSPPFCHCCVSSKIYEQSTSSRFHFTVILVSFVQITTAGVAVSTIPDVTMCISLFLYKTFLYSLPLQEWCLHHTGRYNHLVITAACQVRQTSRAPLKVYFTVFADYHRSQGVCSEMEY